MCCKYFKFNLTALLRGDSKSRADYYRTLVNIGVISPDEVRAFEDMNSMGGPSENVYMQSNMMPLDSLGEGTTSQYNRQYNRQYNVKNIC